MQLRDAVIFEACSLGDYVVFPTGEVLSCLSRKLLTPRLGSNGRPLVTLTLDGKHETHYIHVLVARCFLGPRPEGMVVSHVDGNKLNNRLDNLVYESQKENMARKRGHGTRDDGCYNSRAAFSPPDLVQIKYLQSTGMKQQQIADMFNVSRTTVQRVLAGKRYGGDVNEGNAA